MYVCTVCMNVCMNVCMYKCNFQYGYFYDIQFGSAQSEGLGEVENRCQD